MNTLNHSELSTIIGGDDIIPPAPPPPYTPPPLTPPAPPPAFNVYAAPGIDPAYGIELAR